MDRAHIYGATAPGTEEQIRIKSHFERCSHHVQQILNMDHNGAPQEILNLLYMDSHSGHLQETDHHWSERADLENEEKGNQGNTSLHTAYTVHKREITAYNNTSFGRGKVKDDGTNMNVFAVEGVLPPIGEP